MISFCLFVFIVFLFIFYLFFLFYAKQMKWILLWNFCCKLVFNSNTVWNVFNLFNCHRLNDAEYFFLVFLSKILSGFKLTIMFSNFICYWFFGFLSGYCALSDNIKFNLTLFCYHIYYRDFNIIFKYCGNTCLVSLLLCKTQLKLFS